MWPPATADGKVIIACRAGRLAGIKHCASVEKVSSGCVNRITNKKLNKNAKSASEYGDNAVALNRSYSPIISIYLGLRLSYDREGR
jgi:hypothetical protein